MNKDEIIKAITENAELRAEILPTIAETTEGKTLLENHAKAFFDSNIGSKVSEIYNNIDNDIFEITGERKDPNVKTFDFVKSQMTAYKELLSKGGNTPEDVTKLKAKIQELEKGDGKNEFWKTTHENALSQWEKDKLNLRSEIETLQTSNLHSQVGTDLSMGLAGIEVNPNIPQVAIDSLINTAKASIINDAKVIDGKIVYHKPDGTPWLNNQYAPITAKEIFKETLKDVLKPDNYAGGGANARVGSIVKVETGDGSTEKLVLDKSKVTSKVSFTSLVTETLLKQGVERGSKQWLALSDSAYKEYNVKELPRV